MFYLLHSRRLVIVRYPAVVDYQPMTIAKLAAFVAGETDFDARWRLVVEFLKEYHQEPPGERQRLLTDAPGPTGDERWDVLFAGLAEHLATLTRCSSRMASCTMKRWLWRLSLGCPGGG
jgi:hypothetical protein